MNNFPRIYFKILILIFILAFFVRVWSIFPHNIIFDYDQFEDLFHTRKILQGDPTLIGRPIYGNPNLHHGVIFFYFNIIPFLLFDWNPIAIVIWNMFFNSLSIFIIYLIGSKAFKSNFSGVLSAIFFAASSHIIQLSGWISSTAITLFFVPLSFLGLWLFCRENKSWGLYIAVITLGFAIQAEIFFVYLIPIFILYWIFSIRSLNITLNVYLRALVLFILSISPLIYTEIKLNFAGIKVFLNFSNTFDDSKITIAERFRLYSQDFISAISPNLSPSILNSETYVVAIIVIIAFLLFIEKRKNVKTGIIFMLVYIFSSTVMLIFGYHKQPWSLIGILPAICLLQGFVVSKIRPKIFIIIVLVIYVSSSVSYLGKNTERGPVIFKAEESSLLSSQLKVIDYTYNQSEGKPYSINSVSYPLYHNALWEYNYHWYGASRYKYLPSWSGGKQLSLYKVLDDSGEEQLKYMIVDTTVRIPEKYKKEGEDWAKKQGKIIDKQLLGGFIVYKILPNE